MSLWSRYLFGASLVFGIGVTILAERLPAGWGPASLLAMVLAAAAFLIRSIIDHRRERSAIGSVEDQDAGLPG
ncbi:hypothetical protein [uncultured Arthrobacter sp.]|uniref:hypothetical protein n=1 Tax=uncultured Arthrobacter sp. TaxID=114050 RepID=UPI0026349698|nr:hypothetical protein [uncultured Arthrobacter sp.]